MTTILDAPRLGTRATLVHVRRIKRHKPRCACCGEATLYKGATGKKGYSQARAVLAQVYVSADIPLGPYEANPRDTAPAVLEGGVWARWEAWHLACYEAAGQPYGPVLGMRAA